MTITKEQLDEAVTEAVEKATKGLKEKNDELLSKLTKEKEAKTELQKKADEAEAAKRQAEEDATLKTGDVEKITKTLTEKFTKEIETLKTSLADKDTKLHGVLVEQGLTDALIKANVAPQHIEATKALIEKKFKAEIVEIDGKSVAQIGGKPIEGFIVDWSQGDGKQYVAAPANGGGGSHGQNGGGQAPVGKKRSEMNPAEKAKAIRDHGQEAYNKIPE